MVGGGAGGSGDQLDSHPLSGGQSARKIHFVALCFFKGELIFFNWPYGERRKSVFVGLGLCIEVSYYT